MFCSEIATATHWWHCSVWTPNLYYHPWRGWPYRNLAAVLGVIKLEWWFCDLLNEVSHFSATHSMECVCCLQDWLCWSHWQRPGHQLVVRACALSLAVTVFSICSTHSLRRVLTSDWGWFAALFLVSWTVLVLQKIGPLNIFTKNFGQLYTNLHNFRNLCSHSVAVSWTCFQISELCYVICVKFILSWPIFIHWVLVCWWWRFDWTFACLIAPIVTTSSIILSCNKIQNRHVLVPANPDPSGKWLLKWRESCGSSSSSIMLRTVFLKVLVNLLCQCFCVCICSFVWSL